MSKTFSLPDPRREALRLASDPDHLRRKAAYLREVAAHPLTHPDRARRNLQRAAELEARADDPRV
jgi:hypothetical protein